MKNFTLVILIIGLFIPISWAKDNKYLFLKHREGETMAIAVPSHTELQSEVDYLEMDPYGYRLRVPSRNVVTNVFLTPQREPDSITPATIIVDCDKDKVTMNNISTTRMLNIYDNMFRTIQTFPSGVSTLEFEVKSQPKGLYWLNAADLLIGVDTQKKKK